MSQILETISILDSVVIFPDPLRSFTKMAKVQKQTWLDFSAQHYFSIENFLEILSMYYLPDILGQVFKGKRLKVDEKYRETVAVFIVTKVH